MIKKYLTGLSLLTILPALAFNLCAEPLTSYLPQSSDVSDYPVLETLNIRSDQELFDYMNGGAEMYRAFNFRRLSVRSFQMPDEGVLKVELYMFKSPADAYGMFTMLPVEKEIDLGNGGGFDLGTLRFWEGKYFCKVFLTWSDWYYYKDVILAAGKAVDDNIEPSGEIPPLVNAMPERDRKKSGIYYFYDYIALKNLMYITHFNLFNLNMSTEAVLGEYSKLTEEVKLLLIRYPSEKECDEAYKTVLEEYIHSPQPQKGYFLEAQMESALTVQIDRRGRYLIFGMEYGREELLSHRFEELRANLLEFIQKKS